MYHSGGNMPLKKKTNNTRTIPAFLTYHRASLRGLQAAG
jgi:hypothetical protein